MKDRHFQALWIHLTEEEFKRALSADPSICPHKTTIDGNESKNLKEESAASEHHQASISSILDDEILDLCAAIQVSVDTFNRSLKFLASKADSCCETHKKIAMRKASLSYSVKVQLERLRCLQKFNPSKCRLLVRQLKSLLKTFATIISCHCDLQVVGFYAASLCDMLYRFEEFCSVTSFPVHAAARKHKQSPGNRTALRASIDSFRQIVVTKLEELCTSQSPALRRAHSAIGARSLVPVIYHSPLAKCTGLQQRSFLLSSELGCAKQRWLSHHQTPSPNKAKRPLSPRTKKRCSLSDNRKEVDVLGRATCITRDVINDVIRQIDQL